MTSHELRQRGCVSVPAQAENRTDGRALQRPIPLFRSIQYRDSAEQANNPPPTMHEHQTCHERNSQIQARHETGRTVEPDLTCLPNREKPAAMPNNTKRRSEPVCAALLILLMVATGLNTAAAHPHPQTPAPYPTQFTDVPAGQYYTTAVDWMVQNQITSGTSPTTFHPDRNVTRGEAAAFVWRMACRPQTATPHGFSDIHAAWQQQPVSWLQQQGAAPLKGTAGEQYGMYNPSVPLTRGQMAGLLYDLFADDAWPDIRKPYNDVTEEWQLRPVAWLHVNEITTGTSPTMFSPDHDVTRGQLATFLWRHSGRPGPEDRICQPPH